MDLHAPGIKGSAGKFGAVFGHHDARKPALLPELLVPACGARDLHPGDFEDVKRSSVRDLPIRFGRNLRKVRIF